MKIFNYFLLSLVLVSGGIAHVDAAKQQNATLSPNLIFGPHDPEYYAIIEDELNKLQDFFTHYVPKVGIPTVVFTKDYNVLETASIPYKCFSTLVGIAEKYTGKNILTRSYSAQDVAPTIYTLLSTKIHAICTRMNLDPSIITIAIDFLGCFNAGADSPSLNPGTKELSISFDYYLIKLFAWLEGSKQYHTTEGLLDGIIAHELAHLFHKHNTPQLSNELEADRTGALCLQVPENIRGVCLLGLPAIIYCSINYSGDLMLLNKDRFFITCVITKSLIKKYPNLGALANCRTSGHMGYNICKAMEIIKKTAYPRRYSIEPVNINPIYSFSTDTINELEPQDRQNICSLIYHQITSCCIQCVQEGPVPSDRFILEETSHPGPRKRNEAICKIVHIQKQKLVMNTIRERLLKNEIL